MIRSKLRWNYGDRFNLNHIFRPYQSANLNQAARWIGWVKEFGSDLVHLVERRNVGYATPGVTLRAPGGPGSAYAFDPSELKFSVGKTVTLVLRSETEYHTFTVDDLGIDEEVDGGKPLPSRSPSTKPEPAT